MELFVASSVAVLIAGIGSIIIYMLPWVIALIRGTKSTAAIFFVSLLFNWTMVGWIGTLIWSIVAEKKSAQQPQQVIIIREKE
ncbi:immunity to superinfection [Escherichia phage UGJNEcP2]|nr:immunity to superinfection [Escherichia phage UGJNEcP1]CAH1616373.1 immunity to superinfection [Escherichia phage UGJNEcP2]